MTASDFDEVATLDDAAKPPPDEREYDFIHGARQLANKYTHLTRCKRIASY